MNSEHKNLIKYKDVLSEYGDLSELRQQHVRNMIFTDFESFIDSYSTFKLIPTDFLLIKKLPPTMFEYRYIIQCYVKYVQVDWIKLFEPDIFYIIAKKLIFDQDHKNWEWEHLVALEMCWGVFPPFFYHELIPKFTEDVFNIALERGNVTILDEVLKYTIEKKHTIVLYGMPSGLEAVIKNGQLAFLKRIYTIFRTEFQTYFKDIRYSISWNNRSQEFKANGYVNNDYDPYDSDFDVFECSGCEYCPNSSPIVETRSMSSWEVFIVETCRAAAKYHQYRIIEWILSFDVEFWACIVVIIKEWPQISKNIINRKILKVGGLNAVHNALGMCDNDIESYRILLTLICKCQEPNCDRFHPIKKNRRSLFQYLPREVVCP